MSEAGNYGDVGIYVVDADFRILYFNDVIAQMYPELACGGYCYQELCGEECVCKTCAVIHKEKRGSMYYNRILGIWIEVNCTPVDWPGAGSCMMMMSRLVQGRNKELFYNLTSISGYDELMEINFSKQTYKILQCREDKYMPIPMEGTSAQLVAGMKKGIIYPDDTADLGNFWNPDYLQKNLRSQGDENAVRMSFRRQMIDGSYRWVQMILVPLEQNDDTDSVYMCFVQDIHEQVMTEMGGSTGRQNSDNNNRDPLTGLYWHSSFFREAYLLLEHGGDQPYCLMALDIEHFKLYNEWHGRAAGDEFLVHIASYLKQVEKEQNSVAGYMGGDDFAIVLPNDAALLSDLQDQVTEGAKKYGQNAGFLPAFGFYEIDDPTVPISKMYDRAMIALSEVKGNYAQRCKWYDNRMIGQLEEDHILLSEVQRALDKGEFIYYLQPQCNMETGKIIGFESLVRWQHPQRGLIAPGGFVPLMEKNGIITTLDFYVWDKMCADLREWINQGIRPVPISVNVSRIDIFVMDIVECFRGLVEKYELDPRLVEIEITETSYTEEYHVIMGVVERLQESGFLVLMDDFGSGYSSLNMLKDVNVDVLKLDMKFLDMTEQSQERGMGILKAITNMARFMGISLIAEGVETREQMEFLLNLGCSSAQGYYFYKPMPVEACLEILKDPSRLDYSGIRPLKVDHMRIRELINDDMFSEMTINNILGGIAISSVQEDKVKLLRVNEHYCNIMKIRPEQLEDKDFSILHHIYEEDHERFMALFHKAYQNQSGGAEDILRSIRGDGNTIWTHARVFFMREQDGNQMYYASVSDVTGQTLRERELEVSQWALASMLKVENQDESFMQLEEEHRKLAKSIVAQMNPAGMCGAYCEEGWPVYFINQELVKLLGYESYDELNTAINGLIINMIHPDDLEQVHADIGDDIHAGMEYRTTYRMPKKNGTWFWVLDKGRVVETRDGRLVIISACTDISEVMMVQQQLAERNEVLQRQYQELYFLNNGIPGGYHRCADIDGFEFTYLSNRFLEIIGYSKEELEELFDNKFINMVHPDDLEATCEKLALLKDDKGNIENVEYRMMSKNGYIWVVDQSRYMEYNGNSFFQCVVMDVTKIKQNEQEISLLNQKMESILRQAAINSWDWDIVHDQLVMSNVSIGHHILQADTDANENMIVVDDFTDQINRWSFLEQDDRDSFREFLKQIRENCSGTPLGYELALQKEPGVTIWHKIVCETLRDKDGNAVKAVGYYVDITKDEVLSRSAGRDALTGLYNRQTAFAKIEIYLEEREDESAIMIILNMDRFDLANDLYGHSAGERMLVQAAHQLTRFFRNNDIVCRVESNQFLILCKNITDETIRFRLNDLLETIKSTCEKDGEEQVFTVSAGYALIPEHGVRLAELYHKAGKALNAVRQDQGNMYCCYEEGMENSCIKE